MWWHSENNSKHWVSLLAFFSKKTHSEIISEFHHCFTMKLRTQFSTSFCLNEVTNIRNLFLTSFLFCNKLQKTILNIKMKLRIQFQTSSIQPNFFHSQMFWNKSLAFFLQNSELCAWFCPVCSGSSHVEPRFLGFRIVLYHKQITVWTL